MSQILLTSAYFPPISYMSLIAQSDLVYIEAHENYQKQSYRNRCYIAGPNGKQMLNIPVIKTNGNHTLITEVQLSEQMNWKKHHWNSIQTAYNSSPFMLYYEDEIKAIFFAQHQSLWELNMQLLELMIELLQLNTEIKTTTSFEINVDEIKDFRQVINPKKEDGITYPNYIRVYEDKNEFMPNLSILDLLFNMGPEAGTYIKSLK